MTPKEARMTIIKQVAKETLKAAFDLPACATVLDKSSLVVARNIGYTSDRALLTLYFIFRPNYFSDDFDDFYNSELEIYTRLKSHFNANFINTVICNRHANRFITKHTSAGPTLNEEFYLTIEVQIRLFEFEEGDKVRFIDGYEVYHGGSKDKVYTVHKISTRHEYILLPDHYNVNDYEIRKVSDREL